jgi:hypothetical protein
MIKKLFSPARLCAAAVMALAFVAPSHAWEPTKPVEFVVPAGTGGGADQMARLVQGIVIKHKLMKEPLIVVNKSSGAGAEGFLAVKEAKGDPLYMTPKARRPHIMYIFGTIAEVQHKERGTYLTVGSPIKFSDMKVEITGSPLLGEHTDEVLAELGYSADKIATLHAAKAV